MEEIDIWRTANQLIKEYGPDARSQAVYFASKRLEHRDYDGYAVWGLVWTAVKILQEQQAAGPSS